MLYFASAMKTYNPNELKKVQERQWLDAFKEVYEHFPSGKIMASESPDFVIQLKPRSRIGIEITQYEVYRTENQKALPSFVDAERMTLLIEKKNEKQKLYQKKWLNAYWLLIVINTEIQPTRLRFSENLMQHYHAISVFDRLFVLDYGQRRLYY